MALNHELLVMAVATKKRVRLDLARVVDKNLRCALSKQPNTLSENRELRTYLYMLCLDAPIHTLPPSPPTIAAGASSARTVVKRTRVLVEIRTPERPPLKKQ